MNDTKDLVGLLRQPSDFYSTDKMTAKRANALYTSLMQDAADHIEALAQGRLEQTNTARKQALVWWTAVARKDALLREALRTLKYHTDQTRPIEQTFDMMEAIKLELSK